MSLPLQIRRGARTQHHTAKWLAIRKFYLVLQCFGGFVSLVQTGTHSVECGPGKKK